MRGGYTFIACDYSMLRRMFRELFLYRSACSACCVPYPVYITRCHIQRARPLLVVKWSSGGHSAGSRGPGAFSRGSGSSPTNRGPP